MTAECVWCGVTLVQAITPRSEKLTNWTRQHMTTVANRDAFYWNGFMAIMEACVRRIFRQVSDLRSLSQRSHDIISDRDVHCCCVLRSTSDRSMKYRIAQYSGEYMMIVGVCVHVLLSS